MNAEENQVTNTCWRKEFCYPTILLLAVATQITTLAIVLYKKQEILPIVTVTTLVVNVILGLDSLSKKTGQKWATIPPSPPHQA